MMLEVRLVLWVVAAEHKERRWHFDLVQDWAQLRWW